MPDNQEFNRQTLRLPGQDYSADGFCFLTICSVNYRYHFGAIFNDIMALNEIGQIIHDEWDILPDRFPIIKLGPFCVMPNHVHGILQITAASPSPSPSTIFVENSSVGAGLAPALATNHGNWADATPDSRAGATPGSRADEIPGKWADEIPGSWADETPDLQAVTIHGTRAGASPAPTRKQSNQEKEDERKKEEVTLGNIVGAYKSLVMKECLKQHKAKFPEGSEVPLFGKIWQRNYYEHIIRTQKSYDQITAYILTNPQNWSTDKFYLKFEKA
jgi:REP element-mobilizing transposase RayT